MASSRINKEYASPGESSGAVEVVIVLKELENLLGTSSSSHTAVDSLQAMLIKWEVITGCVGVANSTDR